MLKIQFKDGRSEAVSLLPPGKTIGRGLNNDVVIDQDGVNGFHADLQVDGDQVIISDVNTKTGTYLNGEKVLGPTTIRAGDTVSIQGIDLLILDPGEQTDGKTLVLSGTAMYKLLSTDWSLIAGSGPEKGQQIPIHEKTAIGRALECDISILEPALSRKHAVIEPVDGRLVIKDLGSSNGTYVNGKKIKSKILDDKDIIQFNKIRFRVKAPG
ncbi:MAG: FHA domain-containing protein [Pseudomonadales bacterium]|nr:FHA domain-containing protein [Pseudomonadales bacterium]